MQSTLPTLEDVRVAFDDLQTACDRLAYLVEVGGTLPEFPAAARVDANRVQGCQSRTWLVARQLPGAPPRWEFRADSDAPMARGLVAILLAAYSGRTADADFVVFSGHAPAHLPAKFEAGAPPIVPAIGLAVAIEYLERIGLDGIAAHEPRLTHHAHRRLADLPQPGRRVTMEPTVSVMVKPPMMRSPAWSGKLSGTRSMVDFRP